MAALIRDHDWSTTPLGTPDQWPETLRVVLATALASPRAIGIYWGTDFICLYNDAYRLLIGDKHPSALGRPARDVFPEARKVIGPMFRRVMDTGHAATEERRMLPLERGLASLEGWFTYTAEPIFDAGGTVVGILNPAAEVTQLMEERRGREEAEARGDELAREVEIQRREAHARHEIEEHFRRIADAAPALLWVTAPSGACTFLSQSWYDYTGTEPGTGLGYGWLNAVHPEDRDDAEERFIVANARHERLQSMMRLQTPEGSYRWVINSGRPRFDAQGAYLGQVGAIIDVDEREQVRRALQLSEGRYASLFSAMDEGFCVIEVLFDETGHPRDYRFLEINPAFAAQTGLRDALGRTVRELVPDLEESWVEAFARVMRTGESTRFEQEAATMGRWFDVYAFPVGEPDQRRVGVLFRDVTRRRHNEAALEASAARAVIRARLTDVLRTPGPRRAIQTASALLLGDYLGTDRTLWCAVDEARGTVQADVEHMASATHDSATGVYDLRTYGPGILDALRAGAVLKYADVVTDERCPDALRQELLALSVHAFVAMPVVRNGGVVALLAVHQFQPRQWLPAEIALIEETAERTWTAIQRSEAVQALRASEERFRRLADSMPQVVWIADDSGTVEYYNSRSAGYDGTVARPDGTWDWQPIVHPDDLARTLATWDRAVETGNAYECEHRIRMSDGTYRWHLSRAERGETHGVAQWYGTATDIHELMLANELKDRFLAIASHKLRNPVAIIHGTAQQMRRSRALGTLSDERFDRYLDSLVEISTHLANLTNDLTDVSRLQRGALPLNVEPMDIAGLLRDVATREEWAPRVRLAGVSQPVEIHADRHRLRQVVSNLIDNALKYSPSDSPVDVQLEVAGDGVTVEVTDYGIGLSAEDQRSIFTPFGRGANAGTIPGLGMGLFVARGVVERHGGKLRAFSAGRGQGTTMSFWLPRMHMEA